MSADNETLVCPFDFSRALDFDPSLGSLMERDSPVRIRLPYGAADAWLVTGFEAVKQGLSLVLVIGVFVNLERGGGLVGRSVPAAVAIFLAIATNVYLAMVLRPRMNYFRMKVGSFDSAAPDDPWRRRFDRLHRRGTRVLILGWIAAAAGLAFWP